MTFAQCLTGHSTWFRGGLYVVAQLLGAIFGALLQVLLVGVVTSPNSYDQLPLTSPVQSLGQADSNKLLFAMEDILLDAATSELEIKRRTVVPCPAACLMSC